MNLTNDHFEDFVLNISNQLPEMCSPSDLAKTGLVSNALLSHMRKRGSKLPYIKLEGKILYLKKDILNWIREARLSKDKCKTKKIQPST